MMTFGKANRLARIFSPETHKTVMLAIDHGMALGAMTGLEDPKKLLDTLSPHTDSIMLNKGILVQALQPRGDVGIVLRISGGATIAGPDITNESITTSVEQALKLSADCVATSIFVGTDNEFETITSLSRLADECDHFGMPLLAVTAVGKDRERSFDPKYLCLSVRVAAEMGADIIKTYFCESDFEKVVEAAAGVPVVIAGGPKMDSNLMVLETAAAAISAGASGVDMGRNVWQSDNPIGMLKALKAVIHQGATAKDAYSQFIQG